MIYSVPSRDEKSVAAAIGVNSFFVRDYIQTAVKFNAREIENVILLLHQYNLKGIGVNDRFVFLNELFRGDEAMYERSLKTINSFRILPEAEYWINRELKIKLGWDDNLHTTQQFYQLVRRRFS